MPVPKLYQIKPAVRAYLYSEGERLIQQAEHQDAAFDDCEIRSRSGRRIRSLAGQGICEEPTISPDAHSSLYDYTVAKLTKEGAHLLGEVMRRCIPDGRILRD